MHLQQSCLLFDFAVLGIHWKNQESWLAATNLNDEMPDTYADLGLSFLRHVKILRISEPSARRMYFGNVWFHFVYVVCFRTKEIISCT